MERVNGTSATYSTGELVPVVYDELRRMACQQLQRETPGITLTATALVHEAYLRLSAAGKLANDSGAEPSMVAWNGKGHFLSAAAEAMRRILVDQARRRQALKRGGDRQREELAIAEIADPRSDLDLVALDEALASLEAQSVEKATLVKLLYFVGLTIPEAAAALHISVSTAERWWAYARAWLFDQLRDDR